MGQFTLSRRGMWAGLVGLAAAASLRQAVAETAAVGGSWLDMVKQHHALIGGVLDRIVATHNDQAAERGQLHARLAYLLTAHSVAEENVLYPALARYGMTPASDQLYIEQAHAKVINADLGLAPKGTDDWLQKVQALRTAVLHHAKDEEEGDLFPKLQAAAGDANAELTTAYAREFGLVRRA